MLSAQTPISFEFLVNPGTQHEGVAQLVQEDLAVIGIDMTIRSVEWNVIGGEMAAGQLRPRPSGHVRRLQRPHLLPGDVHQHLRQQLLPARALKPIPAGR